MQEITYIDVLKDIREKTTKIEEIRKEHKKGYKKLIRELEIKKNNQVLQLKRIINEWVESGIKDMNGEKIIKEEDVKRI